jgi:cytochrome c
MAAAGPPEPVTPAQERGRELFGKCEACHTLSPDGGRRAGPSLIGLFGRRAGSLPGYSYSEALAKSDLVWNEETVSSLFAEGPEHFTPGSKMPLQRMSSAEDRADLIAYLKLVTAPPAPLDSAGQKP